MQTLRIFISSPGDVADERQIAGKVIERLQGKYWSFVRLDDVFWEQKVIRSTAHYQDELVNPGDCEMVVGILWSRLGSLMPEKFRKASGERYDSGTEWELEMAFEAYEQSLVRTGDPVAAKPDIVIYRRNQPPPQFADPEQAAQATAQITRLDAYFRENYWFPDGTIKRPVTNYATLDEFEAVLSRNLEELILRQIPGLKPGFEPPPISGSPFKGLQAFDFADSDRYFGRNREIREIQQRLITNDGKGLPFVLIYGGSGYGKSSLMRAGLAPVLTRPGGSIDAIQGWRRVPFQPAKGDGTLCERFARALLLPPPGAASENSRLYPHWPLTGLAEIGGRPLNPVWDVASLTRHFTDDEKRGFAIAAIVETLENLNRHLLLEIDQLEEIFTVPGIDDIQRADFLRTIGDLCLTGRVWTVATMRSEFFPRIAEQPELFDLVGKDRGYILPPPDRQSLREIIRYPALAARLDFERRIQEIDIAGEKAKQDFLHDQILADAESSPDALPLIEFTLQQLYDDKRDTLLTWDAYVIAGGLKGAIAQRATRVYETLGPVAQEARHRIFASLVHIDPTRGTVTRQRAPLDSLKTAPGSKEFLDAFLDAHLLVTDEDAAKHQSVITLAHEALISHWDELFTWIQNHKGELLARQRLREHSNLWLQNGRKKTYLLSEARLAEAQRVSEQDLFSLSAEEVDFLKVSQQRSRKKLRVLQVAVAVFAMVALVAIILGSVAKRETRKAEDSAARAISAERETAGQLRETQRQLDRSQLEEGKAWLERARAAGERKDYFATVMLAARAAGFVGYGRESASFDQLKELPPLLGREMTVNLEAEAERADELSAVQKQIEETSPSVLLVWSSPVFCHHRESVSSVAFSPDGYRLASGSEDETVKLWDVATGKEVATLSGHTDSVTSVAYSPDGTRLASGSMDKTLKLWDVATGKEVATLSGHKDSVTSVAYSPDGTRLASGSEDKTVKLWDVATGKELATLSGHTSRVTSVAYSPDGTRLASGAMDNTVKFWDVATGKENATLSGHTADVYSVAYSPDGTRLASGAMDNTVKFWDVATGKENATLSGHTADVYSVAFSPDGTRLASGSMDKTVKFWDVATGKELATLSGHTDGVTGVAFSPDGTRLASGSADNTVKLWDVATGKEIATLSGHTDRVTGVAFSPDGTRLASGSVDKTLKLWDVATGKELATLSGHTDSVISVAFSPDGTRLASGSEDKTVKLWDVATGKELATLSGHTSRVTSVAYSPDGTRLASGAMDNTVKFWDVATGKENATLSGHTADVYSVAFSPDGTRLASGSRDKTVKFWDVATGKENATLSGHTDSVISVAFSPDGTRLASGSEDKTVKFWDVATGKENATLSGHTDSVISVAFSPDGTRLASGSMDKTVKFWDVATGKENATLSGHTAGVWGVAYTPDGTRLASGDNTVKLWEVATGKELATLSGHTSRVTRVAFSPDGTRLASGAVDNTVKFWDVATGKELATLSRQGATVTSLTFSADGTRLASGSVDKTLKLWDVATGKELATLSGHTDSVTSVAYSPDGTRLASGSEDKIVKLWDVATGKELATFSGHGETVTSLAFSPDGTRLASGSEDTPVQITPEGERVVFFATGSEDNIVKLWDVATGKEIATLSGHEAGVWSVAFSPDGTRLASGSEDKTVKFWDVATGEHLATLSGHRGRVTSVAFSPDGYRLASGSEDNIVKLWDVATGKEVATLSGHTDSVTSVAFSPDGTRLASGDNTVKLWEVATGKELEEVTDALYEPFLSSEGQRRTKPNERAPRIRVSTTTGRRFDLLGLMRQGLFKFEEREMVWNCNPSLFSSLEFTAVHYREDELAALAEPDVTPAQTAALRLQLMSRASQWRAARSWWQQDGAGNFPKLRVSYLRLLLTSAGNPAATAVPSALGELTEEVTVQLTKEAADDIGVSVSLSDHLLRRSTDAERCPETAWQGFLDKVAAVTPEAWREGVVARITKRLAQAEELPAQTKQRLEVTRLTLSRLGR